MTKDEIKEKIRAAGVYFKSGLTKDQLQTILDKIEYNPNNLDVEQLDVEPELDENGDPIDPELGGVGNEEEPSEYEELLGKIEGAQPPEPKIKEEKPFIENAKRKRKKGESASDSFRIEGYVLLIITDTIFPFTFAFINNLIDKKVKINATDLQLAQKDFDKLEPLADQAADYMSIGLNPIAGFLLVATFMYSNNLLALRMQIESNNKI